MAGKVSADTLRALRLIKRGYTPYAAAKKVGIALSTIYRAQKRIRLLGEQSDDDAKCQAQGEH